MIRIQIKINLKNYISVMPFPATFPAETQQTPEHSEPVHNT